MQLRSVFVDSPNVYLVMDLMDLSETRSLLGLQKEYCTKNGLELRGIPESIVKYLGRQAISGLCALHARNLVHRDVKPDNILVNTEGVARVADFGISKLLVNDDSVHVDIGDVVDYEGHDGVEIASVNDDGTYDLIDCEKVITPRIPRKEFIPKKILRTNSFVGTHAYISPQMAKASGVSLKEDIWALGIVIYEWAVGRHPFSGQANSHAELFGLLWKVTEANEGITLPSIEDAGGQQFSEGLHDVVAKCLRKRPSERPTAAKLIEHPFFRDADVDACKLAWDVWIKQIKD